MHPWKVLKNQKCLTSLGIILTVTGITLLLTSSTIFNKFIDGELVLAPNKYTYEVWKKTPLPLTLSVYFFHWLNPEDIRNPDIKPRLEEKGPYVFKETKEKVDIVWNPNGTVSYKQLRFWYFDEERSNGSLSDEITTLNPVAVSAAAQTKHLNYLLRKGLDVSMRTLVKDVHITKTAGEMLFGGYNDMLIDVARALPKIENIDKPTFDKFGWLYTRNGSKEYDGYMTMGTGVGDIPLGMANRWNYKQESGAYGENCGKIDGSAGEFWPTRVAREDISMFFWIDMCRSLTFEYEKDVFIKGMKGYRFVGSEKTLDNGTKYPENKCYCAGECVPSGVANVTTCRFGAPGFISFPHFYTADPYYINAFEGLNPNKEEHELSITLEPRTGIPLSVSGKFQVNVLLQPNKDIAIYNDVPRLFFPMIWLKQEAQIPDNFAAELNLLINLPFAGTIGAGILLVIGAAILITLAGLHIFRNKGVLQKNLQSVNFSTETEPLDENKKGKQMIVFKPASDTQISFLGSDS